MPLKVAVCLVLILAVSPLAIMPAQANGWDGHVHSLGYWRTHNSYADVRALRDSWPLPEDTSLMQFTYFEVISMHPENGDAWIILAQQWIVALLNVFHGAGEPPDDVWEALWEGEGLLWEGYPVSVEDREYALGLAEILTAYNEGLMGPPPYPD